MLDRLETTQGAVLARLRAAAAKEDAGAAIGPSVEMALDAGLVDQDDAALLACALVAVAESNLPLARLLEGHVNARLLLRIHGDGLRPAGLLGVWGADGAEPVGLEHGRLRGSKRFASGLGVVRQAVVTVGQGEGTRLALVDVSDRRRHRPGTWDMLGMRATVSGDVDLTGLEPRWLGPPGAYFREPYFLGGVWRIAALQLGGALGLLGAARDALRAAGRLDAEAQVGRLAPLLGRAMAAFGLVERAADVAHGVEGRADTDRAVMLSLQSRLLTEELAQDAVAAVERSVGLVHFSSRSETGRIARDLATYCRQATRDAFEQRAGRTALERPGPLSGLWHG